MKTKWIIIPLAAFALGCTREIDSDVSYIEGVFSLYASSGENETKTILQKGGGVFWCPEDSINVFYGDKSGVFVSNNTEAAASAEFMGTLGSFSYDGETEFMAAYPYSGDTRISGKALSIILPSEQTAAEGTFADDLFICVAKSKDFNLHFFNVCGGVKFMLARDDIKKVVFRGNNGEELAGRLSVEFTEDGLPVVTGITDGKSSVTLCAPADECFKVGVWYYLVLAPQSLSSGYSIDCYADELFETVSSDNPVSIQRSSWGVLRSYFLNVDVPEMIDLGLPSGLLWGSFNLGASKPEEYGNNYAWGEIDPKNSSEKSSYSWFEQIDSYSYALTKYCYNSDFGYNGFTDERFVLDSEDDAARVHLGEKWRIPTKAEFDELLACCTWEFTQLNEVKGNLVTGPNGNSIFLPFSGYGSRIKRYWTSSLGMTDPIYAYSFYSSDYSSFISNNDRCTVEAIRPVYGYPVAVENLVLDKTEIELGIGETVNLIPLVLPVDATNKKVIWYSDNDSVASVSESGIVSGLKAGTARITVLTVDGENGVHSFCHVTVKEGFSQLHVPEVIDLGLPSGIKWASFNLGASKPEEYGFYYAWGEILPKVDYRSNTYKFGWSEDGTGFSKYSRTDGIVEMGLSDDAANANLGRRWRIPTLVEQEELRDNCTWTWTTYNGVDGYLITSNINQNSIFLPAAGQKNGNSFDYVGAETIYWSPTLDKSYYMTRARGLDAEPTKIVWGWFYRYRGQPIRPVFDGNAVLVENISLDKTQLEIPLGGYTVLNAIFSPQNSTCQRVCWASSDNSIVTVSSSGAITGLALGEAIITATSEDGGFSAQCRITVNKPSLTDDELVDLGLPSGILWSSHNLGADKPEGFGDYYAWGETETKQDYSWETYKWCDGTAESINKYVTHGADIYNLEIEDDAAFVNPRGKWRIPTIQEWREIKEYCTWIWTTINGVNGDLVTSKINGNCIFIPAAGNYNGRELVDEGSNPFYWSSSLDNWHITGSQCYSKTYSSYSRSNGLSIRPVYGETSGYSYVPVSSFAINEDHVDLYIRSGQYLTVTIAPENASNKTVFWESANESIATVSSSGLVTGVTAGSTIIKAKTLDGELLSSCGITVWPNSPMPVPDIVDLGLSVKWAVCNLGATKPEEEGNRYAWGEIKTKGEEDVTNLRNYAYNNYSSYVKTEFSWGTYKWSMGAPHTLTKYSFVYFGETYGYNGFVDGKSGLDQGDDAVYVNLGGKWRTPGYGEFEELKKNCTWEWIEDYQGTGVSGYMATSTVPGFTDKSIFFPGVDSSRRFAHHWSASCLLDYGWSFGWGTQNLTWDIYDLMLVADYERYRGQPIRPVYTGNVEDIGGGGGSSGGGGNSGSGEGYDVDPVDPGFKNVY